MIGSTTLSPKCTCKVANYLRIGAAPRKLSANGGTLFANGDPRSVMPLLNATKSQVAGQEKLTKGANRPDSAAFRPPLASVCQRPSVPFRKRLLRVARYGMAGV